jgi:hypothetical protein
VASRGVSVLASGGGRLWAAGTGDTLVAINPQRPTVTLRFLEEGPPPCCGDQPWHTGLAVVGGVMWESVSGGMVYRFPVAPRVCPTWRSARMRSGRPPTTAASCTALTHASD